MITTEQDAGWWQRLKKTPSDLGALAKYYELCNRTDGKSPKTVDEKNNCIMTYEVGSLNG